ncbi:MAG: hypothetical protein ACOYD4_04085 [Solirubrobacterales bacterium]
MAKEKQIDALEGEGAGVGVTKDNKLNALADKFTELRDEKASMAEEMTAIESKIIDRMVEIKCKVYRYADREVRIKDGKTHVKVRQIKSGDESK